jgi:hypothetical protein
MQAEANAGHSQLVFDGAGLVNRRGASHFTLVSYDA